MTAGKCQYGINAPLGAVVPQSEGVSGLAAGVLQSSGNLVGDGAPSTTLMMQTPAWKVRGVQLRRLILTA